MNKIGEQLPAVGVTAASLTLIFLGFLFASWEAYKTEDKPAVRGKFLWRAGLAFIGIVAALLAAVLGFISMANEGYESPDRAGLICLAIWALVTLIQSTTFIRDIAKK